VPGLFAAVRTEFSQSSGRWCYCEVCGHDSPLNLRPASSSRQPTSSSKHPYLPM